MWHRMASLPVTFSDLGGHFCCLKPTVSVSHTSGNTACIIYSIFTHESECASGL